MKFSRNTLLPLATTAFLWFLPWSARGSSDGWPSYMHDAARSGATDERLALPLTLQWVLEPRQRPEPAWAKMRPKPTYSWGKHERNKYNFDEAFHVAVVGDTLYFGSSANHRLYCLDAASATVRWTSFAGGPIRFAPTVSQGKLYFGADDGVVYCLDAATGAPVWRFQAAPDGSMLLANGKMISRWPIRTGVLVDDGVAYFGAGIIPANDTLLYAIEAESGKLIWRNDRWSHARSGWGSASPQGYMLASDRFLFVPCGRAAPAVFDRSDGRFLYQMSGGQHWRDIVGGTFAVLWDKYLFGCGQTVRSYEQATGKVGYAWFPGHRLLIADGRFFLLDDQRLTALDLHAAPATSWRYMQLHHPLAQGLYEQRHEKTKQVAGRAQQLGRLIGQKQRLIAEVDRQLAQLGKDSAEAKRLRERKEKLVQETEAARAEQKRLQKELARARAEFRREQVESAAAWQRAILWQNECGCGESMIYAGGTVLVGGDGKVVAIDAASGKTVWTGQMEGKAEGLAVAGGRLFVSSANGNIYCFGSGGGERQPAEVREPVVAQPYGDSGAEKSAELAELILQETGIRRGYCLDVGCGDGRLALALAKRTDLAIYGIEPEQAAVQTAREKLAAAGLYGSRITVHRGSLKKLPYSDCFANLSVWVGAPREEHPPLSAAELLRCLKPCGGVALIGWPQHRLQNQSQRAEALERWLAELPRDQAKVEGINRDGLWAKIIRGPLPGAGRWTYQYGSPAGTSSSDERLARWPLRLLWYGSPGPTRVLHKRQPSPLVAGGRFYLEENNVIMAYDCYNGVRLWQRGLAGAAWGNAERGSNIACNDNDFFIAIGKQCMRLDGESGRTEATYSAPQGTRWRDIRVLDGTLFGVCLGGEPPERARRRGTTSPQAGQPQWIVAIDVATGKTRWRYATSGIDPGTVAISDGRVFFTEKDVSAEERAEALKESPEQKAAIRDIRRVVALDAASGRPVWRRPLDVTSCCGPAIDQLHVACQDGILVFFGAFWNNHYWGDLMAGRLAGRNMMALSADDGRILWSHLTYQSKPLGYLTRPCIVGSTIYAHPWAFELRTGRQIMVPHPITGERIPFQFGRGHHCGLPSGCPNLLMMRSLTTAFIDLAHYTGTIHFRGQRPGCHINVVPAAGLVVAPESSSGCVCPHAVQATVMFEPCPKREETMWGTYSAKFKAVESRGPHYVKHLAVNVGAFGDRRSADGTLWLSYPRPGGTHIELTFGLHIDTLPGFGLFNHSPRFAPVAGTADPWLYTHGCLGIRRLAVPGTKPDATYTVRLHFADLWNSQPGQRVFDIKLQGQTVANDFDVVEAAAGPKRAVVKEFRGVRTDGTLTVEFVSKAAQPGRHQAPLLCAVELMRQRQD